MIIDNIKDAREGDTITFERGVLTITGKATNGAHPGSASLLVGPYQVRTGDGWPLLGNSILKIERPLPTVGDLGAPNGYVWKKINHLNEGEMERATVVVRVVKDRAGADSGGYWGLVCEGVVA